MTCGTYPGGADPPTAGAPHWDPDGQWVNQPELRARVERGWIDLPKDECRLVARQWANGFEPQREGARAIEPAKRVRLRLPVQIAE